MDQPQLSHSSRIAYYEAKFTYAAARTALVNAGFSMGVLNAELTALVQATVPNCEMYPFDLTTMAGSNRFKDWLGRYIPEVARAGLITIPATHTGFVATPVGGALFWYVYEWRKVYRTRETKKGTQGKAKEKAKREVPVPPTPASTGALEGGQAIYKLVHLREIEELQTQVQQLMGTQLKDMSEELEVMEQSEGYLGDTEGDEGGAEGYGGEADSYGNSSHTMEADTVLLRTALGDIHKYNIGCSNYKS